MASGRPVCAKPPPQLLTPSYAYHIHVTTKGLNGNQVCKIPQTSLNLPDDAHGEKARDVKWDKVTDCSPDSSRFSASGPERAELAQFASLSRRGRESTDRACAADAVRLTKLDIVCI
ncbi:hypothetical protein F2P81_011252 [Scophthalmus maximus]|uniref:Uncharacterized protein n=1 Tax=Scophthalmus maximus TaxID=52904 RepID=A0A6A4SVP2_SCOMX|nr:hypothetical protein F2P81_011252 [Scophthalmus maximus]